MSHPSALARACRQRPACTAVLTAVLALLAAAGCARADRGAIPLSPAFTTKEDAARAFLDALGARDTETLLALDVSETEFANHVWPRLPASRPDVGMPIEYVWADTSTRSRASLAGTLEAHGGRGLVLDSVTFGGPSSDHGTFRIHRDTHVAVRARDGAVRRLRLFGSMIESGGRWKIFSFVVD